MSTLLANPGRQEVAKAELARLIPGEGPSRNRMRKKPPQSARPLAFVEVPGGQSSVRRYRESGLAAFIPRPLLSRTARGWLRLMAVDWALISVDWLALGALLVPLRVLFPQPKLFQFAEGAPRFLMGIALLHAALITLVGYSEGLHSPGKNLELQSKILGKSVFLATSILCFSYWLQGARWAIAALFGSAGLLHFLSLGSWRRLQYGSAANQPHQDTRNVLIVGAGSVGRQIAAHFEQHPQCRRRFCGFLDDERTHEDGVIGRISDLARAARKGFVEEVLVVAPRDRESMQWLLRQAQHLRLDLAIVPDLLGCHTTPDENESIAGFPTICLHAERLPAVSLVVKRLADIIGSAIALVALFPLLSVIAVLVKLDSRGPILYSAQRAGRKGRLFRCHKFRTMVSNADDLKDLLRQKNERSGPFFKITDDPRITRVGRVLRRYSLDELPQLMNVLKGEMSLVGPRPHPLDDVAEYELEHLARLDVVPGITGLWQVTARGDGSFQRGMELDREYIRTWSLTLDMKILLRTVAAVLQGSGQ